MISQNPALNKTQILEIISCTERGAGKQFLTIPNVSLTIRLKEEKIINKRPYPIPKK